MTHAITIGDLLRIVGILIGLGLLGFGLTMFMAGGMSDAPSEGDKAGRKGCIYGIIGIALVAVLLAACSTPAVKERVVTVNVPVATRPITPAQVPPPPAPLPPRPSTLTAAADALLSQVCKLESYVLKADPLLRSSAGMPAATLPPYPECEH